MQAAGGRSSRDQGEMAPPNSWFGLGLRPGAGPCSTVRSIHPAPPCLFNFIWFSTPGGLGPAALQQRARVQREGALAGPGVRGPWRQGSLEATVVLCESPAHFLAKSRTQLSMAHSTSREPVCVFRTKGSCVSSLTGKMKCLAPVGAGRQKLSNLSTLLKTGRFLNC